MYERGSSENCSRKLKKEGEIFSKYTHMNFTNIHVLYIGNRGKHKPEEVSVVSTNYALCNVRTRPYVRTNV